MGSSRLIAATCGLVVLLGASIGTVVAVDQSTAERVVARTASRPAAADNSDSDFTVPENPTKVIAPDLPEGLVEMRNFTETGPDGSTLHAQWLSVESSDPPYPSYILSVIVGPGAGTRWQSERDQYAQAFGPDAAREFGNTVPKPAKVSIHGMEGLAFTNFNGFAQVSWVPRSDVVVTISGLRVSQEQLTDIARGASLE